MKVCIIGGSGMLGSALSSALRGRGYEAHPLSSRDVDVRSLSSLEQAFERVRPDVAVNCAAWVDVEGCERNPNLAFEINARGACHSAWVAKLKGTPLVYMSTDYVFAGRKKTPYVESDPPGAVNIYGLTKWIGEEGVRHIAKKSFIVRTAWLFGPSRKRKTFMDRALDAGREGRAFIAASDQTGSPTSVMDLAHAVTLLLERALSGKVPAGLTIHLTNTGFASRFDLAKKALHLAGIRGEVLPVRGAETKGAAPRPSFSVLENRVWGELGFEPLRPWEEALEEYIREFMGASHLTG